MKLIVISLLSLLALSSFSSQKKYNKLSNTSFKRGETLTYRLHYGFITAGEAKVSVGEKLYKIDDRICYKYHIYGKSTGAFNTMYKIRDNWISYVDTNNLFPELAYRDIQEGKYILKESTFFDQKDTLAYKEWCGRNGKMKKGSFKSPRDVHDIVSGFYFIRNIDFSKMKENETIELNAFFDEEYYKFKIQFKGYDVVKTNLGKVNAIKLAPVMPNNTLFDGEDAILMWLSNDKNRIPLKCKAKMFVGAVELDIKEADHLRYPLNFVKK